MDLLIIRHAQAEDYAINDASRILTAKGQAQSRRVGEFLKSNGLVPDVTLASPYARAKETAEIFCQASGADEPVIEPWLGCGMRPEKAMSELAAYSGFGRVAICGHNPDFAYLAEWLLGSQAGGFHVRKASIIHFSNIHPPGRGGYLEMMAPVSSL
ncbi:MAG: histidine phosphatase family protein [Akkermansiaceae bacterium]|nr:histidine phosphatase family protein [Akkermansiaceae bacterium]